MTAIFTISTTDDNIYEGNETLILRLRSSVDVESNSAGEYDNDSRQRSDSDSVT